MRARAIAIHEVQLGGLMALVAVIVAGVGNELAIRRDSGRIIGAFAIGQRTKRAVSHAELVNFGVLIFVIGFGMAIDGSDQVLAIGCPRCAIGAELVAAVGKIAVGDLARGAALAVYDEELHVAWLEIARAIETINQTIVGGGRIGPFCAGRRGGQIGDVRTFSENQSGEREHLSIRRPADGVGSLLKVSDTRSLPGVHAANVEFLFAVG